MVFHYVSETKKYCIAVYRTDSVWEEGDSLALLEILLVMLLELKNLMIEDFTLGTSLDRETMIGVGHRFIHVNIIYLPIKLSPL